MSNFHHPEPGRLVHASQQRIGVPEHRCDYLAPVRESADLLDELVRAVRRAWPLDYPLPPEIDALLNYHTRVMDLMRDGRLNKLADVCRNAD